MAGRSGDGLIATSPEADLIEVFDKAGGKGKPRYGSLTVCWAKDEKSARQTAHRIWPTVAMESSLSWELPLPQHFEDVAHTGLHQVGPDQAGFFRFYATEVLPRLKPVTKAA